MPPDDATIANMTPQQATEALAAMATAPPAPDPTTAAAATLLPPSTARDAQARLDALAKDPEWGARLLAGHADARRELYELSEAASAAEEPGLTLPEDPIGIIDTTIDGQWPRRHVHEFIAHARELGVSDGAIAQSLNGVPETKAIVEQCRALQRAKQGDPAWVDRLLKGGFAEKREQLLMSIILSGPTV